jgi:hypothetical protein
MGGVVYAALGISVGVVNDTCGGVVAPPSALTGSTITVTTSTATTTLAAKSSGFTVISAGQYSAILSVLVGLTYVPGSLHVTGRGANSGGQCSVDYRRRRPSSWAHARPTLEAATTRRPPCTSRRPPIPPEASSELTRSPFRLSLRSTLPLPPTERQSMHTKPSSHRRRPQRRRSARVHWTPSQSLQELPPASAPPRPTRLPHHAGP